MENIRFRFTGGIADEHEMNFYEFGRFQYGAARFIYTLESFRQNGKVLQRLTTRVNADIRVKAAAEGSFLQDVLVFTAPILAECAIQCHFEAMFAYIWDKILPASKGEDLAVEIAKQEVRRAEQTTLQEVQRTEQVRLMAEVANNNNATTQQALSILESVINSPRPIQFEGAVLGIDALKQYKQEIISDIERKRLIHDNREALAQISPDLERKLTSQLRKSFEDIAKPLTSSATEMGIYAGATTDRKVASIDKETAFKITREQEDNNLTVLIGSIKAYDREAYNGKLRYTEIGRPISFSIRAANRQEMSAKVLEAMRKEEVWLSMYLIRDTYGTPVRAILENISEEDEYDPLS